MAKNKHATRRPIAKPSPRAVRRARRDKSAFYAGLGLALILAAATLIAYWPALFGTPLWDDNDLVFKNTLVQGGAAGLLKFWFSTETRDYFPLTLSAFWLEWHIWGAHVAGYHSTNLALHILNALLLWQLCKRLRIPGAWWAGLLFALHPICVCSGAWIAEQKNTLAMVFYLLGLIAFVRWDETSSAPDARMGEQPRSAFRIPRSTFPYLAALLLFLISLLAKSSSIMLPFVLLLILWWRHRRLGLRDFLATAPFFLLSFALGLITIWFQQHRAILDTNMRPEPLTLASIFNAHSALQQAAVRPEPLAERLATVGMALWFYLGKCLWPLHLAMIYPHWKIDTHALRAWLPDLAWLGLLLGLFLTRRKTLAVFVALSYFTLILLPVLGVIPMSFDRFSLVSDHFIYLVVPAIAALLAAGVMTFTPRPRRWLAHGILAAIACGYFVLSFQRAGAFASDEKMWRDTVVKNPDAWVAHQNLGIVAGEGGQADLALYHIQKAVQEKPGDPELLVDLGNAQSLGGQLEAALQSYGEAIAKMPNTDYAYCNRGILLAKMNRMPEAMADFNKALEINSHYGKGYSNRARLFAIMGQYDRAWSDLQLAAKFNEPVPPDVLQTVAKKLNLKVQPNH